MENNKNEDLFGRTWKMVVVLVGASILFVGSLSGAAVLLTSRAFDGGQHSTTVDTDSAKTDTKATPKADKTSPGTVTKKPVSI